MRKLISLLIVLGMLFVAGPAFGWSFNVTAQGDALAETSYSVGGQNNNAGGYSYGQADYNATGLFIAFGIADGDSQTHAWVGGGSNWRAAAACTKSESSAFGATLGVVRTGVSGFGNVSHNTQLGNGNGGYTGGYAAYSYGDSNRSCLLGHTAGNGGAMTAGYVTRSHVPNGTTSHAVSISVAYSSGGGSLVQ